LFEVAADLQDMSVICVQATSERTRRAVVNAVMDASTPALSQSSTILTREGAIFALVNETLGLLAKLRDFAKRDREAIEAGITILTNFVTRGLATLDNRGEECVSSPCGHLRCSAS
jgi:hypothetical protein